MKRIIIPLLWLCLGLPLTGGEPLLRVVAPDQTGNRLLQNGDFESAQDAQATDWKPAPRGGSWVSDEGKKSSAAWRCDSPSGQGWFGASQTLALNRPTGPLVVRGWSKAENVSGGSDNDYSLYVDLVYEDGTPLWGQTGNFRCGTHDWEQKGLVILPEKPIRTLTLYCLFRHHAGTVWFDDVSVEEVRAGEGAVLFQGAPVMINPAARKGQRNSLFDVFKNQDQRGDANAATHADFLPPSFLVRDAAANSGFYLFNQGQCSELGLRLEMESTPGPGPQHFQGRIVDTTGRDRAVTLVSVWPGQAQGLIWGDDIHRQRPVQGAGDYINQVKVDCGATGSWSLYPVGAVWDEHLGRALAVDPAKPAQYRIGYHAGLEALYLAYDFGLVKDSERFPSSAEFRFVAYDFPRRWGFRAAWQKYMEIFPEHFKVRAQDQGIWMPFTDVSTVAGWQDFGFKFHEGNNNVAWDDKQGIQSFRYTEPMTWWMPMPKGAPRTAAEAIRIRDAMIVGSNAPRRQLAEVSRMAGMFDEAGEPQLLFRDTPWCDGAVWSLNPNPYLDPQAVERTSPTNPAEDEPDRELTNAGTIHWNAALKDRLYGADAKGRLDGEYLDSLEGYVTANLNFRRGHFRHTTVPLTFDSATFRPALFKGLAVFEFTKWMAGDAHRLGKLMFANGVPYRFTFLCPWLDVMGTETDWLRGGKYSPSSLSQMNLWRTLSGGKPYLILMNTDYDQFTPDRVEKYFQRCLFYGMFPSMFSHNASENPYWKNPKWYNRDRPLFKKYIPVIKTIAEAGWRPVPLAAAENKNLLIERFGPNEKGDVFFTVYNETATIQEGFVRFELNELGIKSGGRARELMAANIVELEAEGWQVRLPSQAVSLIQLRP